MPRILVVRGHQATPWELAPWERLPERFDVRWLRTPANGWDTSAVRLPAVDVATRRDKLPRGRMFDIASGVAGERYVGPAAEQAFAEADVIHAEELSFWFAAEAVRHRRGDTKVVQTVWETLPFLDVYRWRKAKRFRQEVLAGTDLFLPATQRAALSLSLEGVPDEKMRVCQPGIDVDRFRVQATPGVEHVILSAGRLQWEKGHQDVLRAVALLARQGLRPTVRVVGSGPEEERLRTYADELGIRAQVTIGAVPYEDMPAVFAAASCLVLMSLPSSGGGLHPFDIPRVFWEEQFGMVFAEAMASGLDIVTTDSGAIPEVLDGNGTLLAPGDWPGLARALADGPLAREPGTRVAYPEDLVQRYSLDSAAERLAVAYDHVLG